MQLFLAISHLLLWAAVLFLGFLLLGVCRTLGTIQWRLDQLELTTPRRVGRDGLKTGSHAPDFVLPDLAGRDVSLADFAGRPTLLVFTQHGCEPCGRIVPELNRLVQSGAIGVLAVANGEPAEVRRWAEDAQAAFPVLTQQGWSVSRQYQVFATPFAFLIDEHGVIQSKGIVTSRKYLGYVLSRGKTNDAEIQDAKALKAASRRQVLATSDS
jgi:methylamine dehydrogenase accessory protein MauD